MEEEKNIYKGIVKEEEKIYPAYINLKNSKYIEIDNLYYAGLICIDYYREQTDLILKTLIETNINMNISIFYEKQDSYKTIKDLTYHIGNVGVELKESNELIVSIGTTFKITKEQLKKFDVDKNNYIKFETTDMGYDVIESEEQINYYKKIIFDSIREICREKNIKTIHLCMSTSVAFTFALGQGFSKNYDPDVIIYNYEKQEYVWGLKLFEKSEDSIINLKNTLDEQIRNT